MKHKEMIRELRVAKFDAKKFIKVLVVEHRVSQASVIRSIRAILNQYALDKTLGLKHTAAVKFAQEVKKISTPIPYI